MTTTTRQRSRRRPLAGDRRGFTIVELIVAILILTVGLLGLAGTSAVIMKQMGSGSRTTVAAAVAQARLDSLSGVDCTLLANGATTTGTNNTGRGVTESWVVTDGNDVKNVVDTVKVVGLRNNLVYFSVIPCRD